MAKPRHIAGEVISDGDGSPRRSVAQCLEDGGHESAGRNDILANVVELTGEALEVTLSCPGPIRPNSCQSHDISELVGGESDLHRVGVKHESEPGHAFRGERRLISGELEPKGFSEGFKSGEGGHGLGEISMDTTKVINVREDRVTLSGHEVAYGIGDALLGHAAPPAPK